MKSKVKSVFKSVILIFLAILLLLGCFLIPPNIKTSKAFTAFAYSDVLVDLEKDENFKAEDYPYINGNHSLTLIQIAESEDYELFLYTYQPSGEDVDLQLTTVSLSTNPDDLNYRFYKLKLLNSNGVFFKYKLIDFKIKSDLVRYYNISEIHRKFNENWDEKLDNDNTITEIPLKVSQLWTAFTTADRVVYSCLETQTIVITDKYVGFVRYPDGYHLFGDGGCDSHFVAFSTDLPIDRLMEADVYYTYQTYEGRGHVVGNQDDWFSYVYEDYAYLEASQKVSYTGDWIFANTYEWNRIETVNDFINTVDVDCVYSLGIFNVSTQSKITENGLQQLRNKQWVLRFKETSYDYQKTGMSGFDTWEEYKTIVGNVSILRLKFETDGKIYNLGVVDNKQTGSGKPVNEIYIDITSNFKDWFFNIWDKLKSGFKWALIIIAILVLIPFVPAILKFILFLIKTIAKAIWSVFKGIWWFISFPFRKSDEESGV